MIDIKKLKENPELIKNLISNGRGNPEKANVDELLRLEARKSELSKYIQDLNTERNKLSSAMSQAPSEEVRQRGKDLKQEINKAEDEFKEISAKWQEIMDWMPNFALEMPSGRGEADNIVLKCWTPKKGYIKEAIGLKARGFTEKYMPKITDFEPKHHLDLGEKLGVIDTKQASKVSGSRFAYLLGKLALVQYGLQQLLFKKLISKGFVHIISPLLVKERTPYGTSHFPEGRDQVYAIENENVEDSEQLYLMGSTEPSNFSYFMDRTLDVKDLPIKLFAYAPAFRSEAGSWGKDTRGIKRVHQFDKIEMNSVCLPSQSEKIFSEFLEINEWLLQTLKISYQLVLKCTADAGYLASAKQVDFEIWLPSSQEFMEAGTDTNTTDYQARRLNIKYSNKKDEKGFVHTVNDTGLAMGRMLLAIIDNFQQKDGSVKIPDALAKIIGFKNISINDKPFMLTYNE